MLADMGTRNYTRRRRLSQTISPSRWRGSLPHVSLVTLHAVAYKYQYILLFVVRPLSLSYPPPHILYKGVQPFVPGGDDEITFDMDGQSFGVDDLCYSSPVPTVFKPYLSTQEEPLAWFMQGAYVSYGYRWVFNRAANCGQPGQQVLVL